MKKFLATAIVLLITGCGIAGQPITPKYTVTQKVGYNSSTGPFSKSIFSVELSP